MKLNYDVGPITHTEYLFSWKASHLMSLTPNVYYHINWESTVFWKK